MRYFSTIALLGVLLGPAVLLPADDDKTWGNIKGRIVWGGAKLPEPVQLNVVNCPVKGKVFSEEWVVNKENKGIRWVFVWLAPDPAGRTKALPVNPALKEIKEKEVVVDQPCCAFEPHALAIREGQKLVAKNSATIAHSFRLVTDPRRNSPAHVLIPAGGTFSFEDLRAQPEPIKVECEIHRWMQGSIGVFAHPYFAVTDADGKFDIKLAPAGDCQMLIYKDGWFGGSAASATRKITVKGGATTDLGNIDWKQGS
jgi:hypothetical protein